MKASVMGRLFYLVAALLRCASAAREHYSTLISTTTVD
jgi:hypothetical protein